MANLFRAYPTNVAGKSGLLPIDKTATVDASIVITSTTAAKNNNHVTLNAPIVVTLTAVADISPLKAVLNQPILLVSASAVDVVCLSLIHI